MLLFFLLLILPFLPLIFISLTLPTLLLPFILLLMFLFFLLFLPLIFIFLTLPTLRLPFILLLPMFLFFLLLFLPLHFLLLSIPPLLFPPLLLPLFPGSQQPLRGGGSDLRGQLLLLSKPHHPSATMVQERRRSLRVMTGPVRLHLPPHPPDHHLYHLPQSQYPASQAQAMRDPAILDPARQGRAGRAQGREKLGHVGIRAKGR